jgi:adenylyltransferase/sulfurtransferase
MNDFYARHLALKGFGDREQSNLSDSTVMLVGCGGLGNLAAMYLCTAGIGKLIVNDFDTVDESNLQRQILFRRTDIGKNKAEVARDRLSDMNPDCSVTVIDKRLSQDELIDVSKNVDVILDCTDNFASRLSINKASQTNKIPLVSGAAIRFEGQLNVFDPNISDSPCYQCIHQGSDETLEDCAGNGILAPVTGVIASCMAVEALKLLTGIGESIVGRLQLYDARTASWREIRVKKDVECAGCN